MLHVVSCAFTINGKSTTQHHCKQVLKDIEALIAYDNDEEHLEIKKYHIEPFLDKSQTNPILAVDWVGQPSTVSQPLLSWGLISVAILSTAVVFLNRANILSKL